MQRLARTLFVTLGLLLAMPFAADRWAGTISYGDTCWARSGCGPDGLNDDCEYQLAYWFMPKLWFDSARAASAAPYYS